MASKKSEFFDLGILPQAKSPQTVDLWLHESFTTAWCIFSGPPLRAPPGPDHQHRGPIPPDLPAEALAGFKPPRPQVRGQRVCHGGSVLPPEQGPQASAHQHGQGRP